MLGFQQTLLPATLIVALRISSAGLVAEPAPQVCVRFSRVIRLDLVVLVWRGTTNQGSTGGALATAGGLVFSGGGTDNQFRGLDARTGKVLWSFAAQTAIVAPPISYELNGTQYVAISVGGNQAAGYYAPNYSRMLVFALGGKATLPAPAPYVAPALNTPTDAQPAELVATGRQSYAQFCAGCHGDNGQTRGATFPDLTRSPMLHTQDGFDTVVLKGALVERGMVSFATDLKPADTAAIRVFIISRAQELQRRPQFGPPGGAGPAGTRSPGPYPGGVFRDSTVPLQLTRRVSTITAASTPNTSSVPISSA